MKKKKIVMIIKVKVKHFIIIMKIIKQKWEEKIII